MKKETYHPQPINTEGVILPDQLMMLAESLAKNVHDIWAETRIAQGWSYGPERNDTLRENPCLVPYEELPDSEKVYDRATSIETLKMIARLGFRIVPSPSLMDLVNQSLFRNPYSMLNLCKAKIQELVLLNFADDMLRNEHQDYLNRLPERLNISILDRVFDEFNAFLQSERVQRNGLPLLKDVVRGAIREQGLLPEVIEIFRKQLRTYAESTAFTASGPVDTHAVLLQYQRAKEITLWEYITSSNHEDILVYNTMLSDYVSTRCSNALYLDLRDILRKLADEEF